MKRHLNKLPLSLNALAAYCDGEIIGDGDYQITTICSIECLLAGGLAFVSGKRFVKKMDNTSGAAFIIKPEWREYADYGIAHAHPEQAFRQILVALTQTQSPPQIAKTAVISPTAVIGEHVSIGEHTVIGDSANIGNHCQIGCGAVIESNVNIGAHSRIGHRAIIHSETVLGEACVIAEGAVLGGQGFGFSFEGGNWAHIPQIGRLVIGDRVHVGANTCIDRGAIDDTVIGDNVIIDNLVQIGHNVHVGEGTAMASGVGIAGSTHVGKYCLLAGKVGVNGHINIADNVQVNGGSCVIQSITESGAYGGSFHVMPVTKWNRMAIYLKQLEKYIKRDKTS